MNNLLLNNIIIKIVLIPNTLFCNSGVYITQCQIVFNMSTYYVFYTKKCMMFSLVITISSYIFISVY